MSITPGPWYAIKHKPKSQAWRITQTSESAHGDIANVIVMPSKSYDEVEANARAIAEVPAMIEALKQAVGYLADLNGSEWIKDNGPGGIDMRQRAKALQKSGYAILKRIEG